MLLLLTKASNGLLLPLGNSMVTTMKGSRLKSPRTIIPLSSPGKQELGQLFLFIYLFVWFGRKWSGRESGLVSSSKLWFLFMWLSDDGPPHNRRLQSIVTGTTQGSVHFSLCSPLAGTNKHCLWTSATLRLSDHVGLTLRKIGVCLILFVCVHVYICAVHCGTSGLTLA